MSCESFPDPCITNKIPNIPTHMVGNPLGNYLNHMIDILNCNLDLGFVPPQTQDFDFGNVSEGGTFDGSLATLSTAGDDPNLTYSIDSSNPCADQITLNADGTFTVLAN